MENLIVIISMYCQFNNPYISKDLKEKCLHNFVNCAIIKSGTTDDITIKKCKEKINVRGQ